MTRVLDRQKAHDLRRAGKSYSQIKDALGLSKSTLSGWLRDYPLSKEQIDALRGKSPIRIERFRETMRVKREKRYQETYSREKESILPLSERELFIAGLFLYWGEGTKALSGSVFLNNTDPQVLKFTQYWLINSLKVPKKEICVYLHLYSDMNEKKEVLYWSRILGIPIDQFRKPYIKLSKRIDINQKGFGHGTCGLYVGRTRLKERIILGLRAVADYYSEKL